MVKTATNQNGDKSKRRTRHQNIFPPNDAL